LAAEQDFAEVQNNLGWMYREGRGVPRDDVEAVKWMRKAAEQDLAAAQNNLGWMYQQGRGVPQDSEKAAAWFRKAASQGDELATSNLATQGSVRYAANLRTVVLLTLVLAFIGLLLIATDMFRKRGMRAAGPQIDGSIAS
jgi:TPR repeat protein